MRPPPRPAGLAAVALLLAACATPNGRARSLVRHDVFESDSYIVAFARPGDDAERLAARFLGDATRGWMIEEYNGRRTFAWGQKVVIPRHPQNPAGVYATGYQLVPVLVYHHIGPRAQGRLGLAVSTFRRQMRYLKAHGYRTVSLDDLIEFTRLRRQLPRRSVALTFDDGYKSFLRYAYPILRELGFTATLFVYTDYVGLGRNALDWDDLRRLADEGFGLGAHDDELIRRVSAEGYAAALSVRREGNPSFVHPLRNRRSQIFADMTLEEFARNLTVFHAEPLIR